MPSRTGRIGFTPLQRAGRLQADGIRPAGQSEAVIHGFDQKGSLKSTARKLSEVGCFEQAVTAGQNYILFGPSRAPREQSILNWHLAQNLAMSGKEGEAALVAITSTRAHDASDEADKFDWNTYVRGTWAFLTKRRELLQRSIEILRAQGGERNGLNASVLMRLDNCFAEPFSYACVAPACQAP